MDGQARYAKATKPTNFFNDAVGWLAAHGISILGSRLLAVRGRTSGQWRTNPVNPLTVDGQRYLVAPRGNTQWARNLRATGYEGELRLGRRVERFRATEVGDDEKPVILRRYLRLWWFESGVFFEGVNARSPEEDLRRIAPGYPVFLIAVI
jgi:deazaflavin-dependent oxidoreductase (nitroreductase family)